MLAFLSDHLSVVGLHPLLLNYLATIAFFAIVYAAFFVVERVRPVEAINWSSIWLNVRLALVLQAAIMILAVWLQPALHAGISGWLPGGAALIKTSSIAQQSLLFVAYLLTYDLLYYWLHRAQHRFDALWAIHKLHHSEPHVNVTTTLRVHWLEEVLKAVIIILPVSVLFETPPIAQGWLAGSLGLWLFFVHANARISFGPLSWLMTSPAAHRIHHSLDNRQSNSNFAVIFPIWDVLFGTFMRPTPGQWPRTGILGEEAPGFLRANVAPFGDIATLSLKHKRIESES